MVQKRDLVEIICSIEMPFDTGKLTANKLKLKDFYHKISDLIESLSAIIRKSILRGTNSLPQINQGDRPRYSQNNL